MSPLSIVHLNTVETGGGAARVANRLHQGLMDCGVRSRFFVLERYSDDPTVIAYKCSVKLMDRASRWWCRVLLSVNYSAADVFVIPSLEEALPLTVLEAMACGTPVVGFDVGGIPDMIRDGDTGYLVPKADAFQLRTAINRLLLDAGSRTFSENCRRLVETNFSLKSKQTPTFDSIIQCSLSEGA